MTNFHEHALWQESYVVLMDVHDVVDELELEDDKEEMVEKLLESCQDVTAKIADGLSRLDHRIGRDCIYASVGLVAIARTQLAVSWGRGLMDDETFKTLDTKYAKLSESLQRYK